MVQHRGMDSIRRSRCFRSGDPIGACSRADAARNSLTELWGGGRQNARSSARLTPITYCESGSRSTVDLKVCVIGALSEIAFFSVRSSRCMDCDPRYTPSWLIT